MPLGAEACMSEAKQGRVRDWQGEVHMCRGVLRRHEHWAGPFLSVDGAGNISDLWHQRDQRGHWRGRPDEGCHHSDLRPWRAGLSAQVVH